MIKKVAFTIILFIILLAGCSESKVTTAKPNTFTVLFNNTEATPFKNDWRILEEYKNRKNVTLDFRLGDDKAYDKALSQTFESGNIPDIVLKCWPEQIESYASNGVLLPFSDYENLMPNFKAYIKKYNLQSELDKLKLKNGKYYILPGYQRDIQVQQWIYRKDVFSANNLKMPKTYDDLFDSLVILKKIYPNTTPITASWSGAHLLAMMGAGYGIPAGWAGTSYYNEKENRWQYSPATDNYKELYGFLNRCYKVGILDSDIFTQSDPDFIKKLEDGRALVAVTWITSGFSVWNEKLKVSGFPNGEWAALPVPTSTIGIKALPSVNKFRKGLVVPIRVISEPYFKDLIKFLDWAVYSEEGMTLTTWGIEGLTYKNTSSGKVLLPNILTPKNAGGTLNIIKEYGFNTMFNLNEDIAFEDYKKPAEIVEFLNNSQKASETAKVSPVLKLDSQQMEAIRIINEKLNPYITEASKKLITGEISVEKDWDSYLAEIEKRGYKTLEVIWNNAWDKQK